MISFGTYLEWLIGLTTLTSALVGGWYGVGKWYKSRRAKIHAINEQQRRRVMMLEQVYVTLKPNGGTSLVDHVAEIKTVTRQTARTLAVTETGRRTLVSVMEIGEWHSDSQGLCTFINPAACRLCNRSESDFLGRNWYNVVHKDDIEWVADEWYRAVAERRTFQASYRWTKSDGTPVPIKVVANPIVDSSGDLIGWVAIVRLT